MATGYNNMGTVYRDQNDHETALVCYQKALSTILHAVGEDNPSTIIYYNNIGNTYISLGNIPKATTCLQKKHELSKKIWGNDYEDVTNTLSLIYTLYLQNKAQSDMSEYHAFLSDVAFTITVDETSDAQDGLKGEYYLLEYNDWNQDSETDIMQLYKQTDGHPATILIMKDDAIHQYKLNGNESVRIELKCVDPSQKEQISRIYASWKNKNQK